MVISMKLGFDLDGCVANFNTAFHALLCERHGDRFPKDYNPADPPVWEWPRHFGYTREEENACWKEVWASRTFWQHLNVIKGEELTIQVLNLLHKQDGFEVYFITNRRGEAAQYQSGWFLANAGFRHPSVILARDKYPIVRALQLDAYIDDKIETANDLARENEEGTIPTRVYLRHTSHNQENRHPRLRVVNSVWEMLEKEGLV